ncbi:MAG: parallel beta-helix domain-containing protein, partial [Polyangiaceae bacterium]
MLSALLFCVSGCSGEDVKVPGSDLPAGCDVLLEPSDDDQSTLQAAVIEAEENATVCLSAGVFSLQTELAIDRDGLTLRGMGPDVSILDFSGQDVGANGINIRSDHVTIRELTVSETPGDGIRATDVDDIRFIETHIIWAAPSSTDNGAYGVYPVGCNGVLVDGCRVVGSRDAGIYVGQSTNVLVQNNDLYGNVGGIEIENTSDAEVTKNHCHDNTSGILIFNLPDLPILDGKRTKVHDNVVENNNLPNFADAGTIVAMVPAGSGFIVLASDSNEIHNNVIKNN